MRRHSWGIAAAIGGAAALALWSSGARVAAQAPESFFFTPQIGVGG